MESRANDFYSTPYTFIKEEAPKEVQLAKENIRERIIQGYYNKEKILVAN